MRYSSNSNYRSLSIKSLPMPILVTVLVVVLLIIQVVVSNSLVTNSVKISQTDSEIQDLREQNAQLQEKIASAAALMTVKEKAKQLGFVRSRPIFLDAGAHVARLIE